jgi:hypothetical protein
MFDVAAKDVDGSLPLARRPREEWQRSYNLEPNLPLVAIGERSDEEVLVRLHSFRMLVRELLEQIQGSHRDEPIVVLGELGELANPCGRLIDERARTFGFRDRTAIAAG